MRVALFITCFNDALYPGTGRSVVTLLRRLGCDVEFPAEQTCCGQMHFNTGYRPDARRLEEHFGKAFAGFDAIVTPSPSCAGMVRENYAEPMPVYELSEFLVDVLGVTDVGAWFPHRVAYHPTCHSLRGLRVGDRPTALLRAVDGLELVELPAADACCGFGGTFATKNVDTSEAMLADKMASVTTTGAEVLCALDNSCLMHIGGGLSRAKAPVRVMHLADILAQTAPAR